MTLTDYINFISIEQMISDHFFIIFFTIAGFLTGGFLLRKIKMELKNKTHESEKNIIDILKDSQKKFKEITENISFIKNELLHVKESVSVIKFKLNSRVINNIELKNILIDKYREISYRLDIKTKIGKIFLKYINKKINDTVESFRSAKEKPDMINNEFFTSLYLNNDEILGYFREIGEIEKQLTIKINTINENCYNQFKMNIAPYLSKIDISSLYEDIYKVESFYDNMKKLVIENFDRNLRMCQEAFIEYRNEKRSKNEPIRVRRKSIIIKNENNMNFNANKQDFTNCTFNDYKNQVVDELKQSDNYTEIDKAIITTIESSDKPDTEKKELLQAITEIKKEQTELKKKPFLAKIRDFIKSHEKVLTTILKVGTAAIFAYLGIKGDLED